MKKTKLRKHVIGDAYKEIPKPTPKKEFVPEKIVVKKEPAKKETTEATKKVVKKRGRPKATDK